MLVAMDLQHPSKTGTGLVLSQFAFLCPSMPHFQHSPDATGVVPGEKGYSRISLMYCPGFSLFHCAVWVLYNAQPAGLFGWIRSANRITLFMHSAGGLCCLFTGWFGAWWAARAGGWLFALNVYAGG